MLRFAFLYALVLSYIKINLAVPPLQFETPKWYKVEVENAGDVQNSSSDDISPYYRLPLSLVPTAYTIRILPILDDTPDAGERFTAPGSVLITVNCVQTTNVITLHAFLLDINRTSVEVRNAETNELLPISGQDYDLETHFYNITTVGASPLRAGQSYNIYIEYVAPISTDRANGLYLASYNVPGSVEQMHMAATQLEPARARQVFPCFDEPRWKAVFNTTIGRNTNYLAMSNGKIIDSKPHESLTGWSWDYFEMTVPMPTYLFAMAVADYAEEVEYDIYRVPVSVLGAPHLINAGAGKYSTEMSARIMNYFEAHFQQDYPMSKVDSIVVPGKGGAMENWGLVTYGNFLMYREGETTESERYGLINIIAHELAHQWFGNLVTCEWWSDIYLNEGFATYFSYLPPFYDEFFPRKYMLNEAVQNAFKYDAGPLSHPIVAYDVYTIPEISAHFDTIPYDKGASIIRMMEGFLTEDTFSKGLNAYLARKRHMVAVQDELFDDLTKAANENGAVLPAGKSIADIMHTWTLQKGFPLIQVYKAGSSRVYLTQERFLNIEDRKKQTQLDPNDLWVVPITYATSDNPDFSNHVPKYWLDKTETFRSIAHDTTQWIMLNVEGMGYYRVLYDPVLADLIKKQLDSNHSVISPLSRSQLLDDYISSAFQDYTSIESALEFTNYLAGEDDFTVWNAVFDNLRSTFNLFSAFPAFEPFKEYFEPRVGGALGLIGVRPQPEDKGALAIMRGRLLDWACAMGNLECVQYSSDLFEAWKLTPDTNPYPNDLQIVLYCATVANGGQEAFDFFLDKYESATSDAQKSRLLRALPCATDDSILDSLLQLSLEENSEFTKIDSGVIRYLVAANSLGREKAFQFISNNFQAVIDFHDGSPTSISDFVQLLSLYYGTAEELNALSTLIEDWSAVLEPVRPTLNNSLRTIEANIAWRNKFYEPMRTWFETHVSLMH